jgi:MFS family permease
VTVPASRDLLVINTAAFLRSFTFGLTGVVLGIYLFRVGLSSFNIGVIVAAGLLGSALATIGVTAKADRAGRRRTLVMLSIMGAIGALALVLTPAVPVLLAMAFVGMLNGTGTDRSAAFTLEQAIIPGLVQDASRTWALAWYNVVLDMAGSLGALAAALPLLLQHWLALPLLASYRIVFLGCAFLGVVGAILYPFASAAVEVSKSATETTLHNVSPATKKLVTRLAGLFSLDAFGGGFLTDALVAYWFFRRFGVAEESLGLLFFAVHLLNAASHLGAACVGTPHRACEHHGVHSPAFQFVPDRCCIRTFLESRSGTVSLSRSIRGNGCAYAPVLRRSRGTAERADLCQRHHESSPQCFLGRRVIRCRVSNAKRGFVGSLGDRWRGQDQL